MVYILHKFSDIILSNNLSSLLWAGHAKRMEENEIQKRVLEYEAKDRRIVGRTGLRPEDYVRRINFGHMAKDFETSLSSLNPATAYDDLVESDFQCAA